MHHTIEKVDIIKDDKDNDQMEDSIILNDSNTHQFIWNIIIHVKAADPDSKISFQRPPNDTMLNCIAGESNFGRDLYRWRWEYQECGSDFRN